MGQVISLSATCAAIARENAVRQAVNERARNVGASETSRRHAVRVALNAMQSGASGAVAIFEGRRTLRTAMPAADFIPDGAA